MIKAEGAEDTQHWVPFPLRLCWIQPRLLIQTRKRIREKSDYDYTHLKKRKRMDTTFARSF